MKFAMRFTKLLLTLLALAPLIAPLTAAGRIQTENQGMQALEAKSPPALDGSLKGWDLRQGIFVCGDVEKERDSYALWMHAMYDKDNLYLLARWVDKTPMNNPGQAIVDQPWSGDCLQLRIRARGGKPSEVISWVNSWRGKDGVEACDIAYRTDPKEDIKNALEQGVRQGFAALPDNSGYIQAVAIPWKLITRGGEPLQPSDPLQLGIHANFTHETLTRISTMDNFKPGITPDRIFGYGKFLEWGSLTLRREPPADTWTIRLDDDQRLPVAMVDGLPVVDWSKLAVKQAAKAAGVKTIKFTTPEDGYVSMIIKDGAGKIVRHLLNNVPFPKGANEAAWDGLTELNWQTPGEPVKPGTYTAEALFHPKFTIEFKGWAGSAGNPPWHTVPTGDWGGDHGPPTACAADSERVYLGWAMSESGRALVACDLKGKVLWRKKFGGASVSKALAADAATGNLYVLGGNGIDACKGATLYKLNGQDGSVLPWPGDTAFLDVAALIKAAGVEKPMAGATSVAAANGRVFLSFSDNNIILALDSKSGAVLQSFSIPRPVMMAPLGEGILAVVSGGAYELGLTKPNTHQVFTALTAGDAVYLLDTKTGKSTRLNTPGLDGFLGVASDGKGRIYIGCGEPRNQVLVLDRNGKLLKTIGRDGGRALLGPWQSDGMRFLSAMAVDGEGKLWVTEMDDWPRRFSAWDTETGKLADEFFGPAHYGGTGAAINPDDPMVMAGLGSEWRIDPETGRAKCEGVITRDGMGRSAYARGANGRLYFLTAPETTQGASSVNIFERTGAGSYVLRAAFDLKKDEGAKPTDKNAGETSYWADVNGDGQRQENEITRTEGLLQFAPWHSWHLKAWTDFTLQAGDKVFRPTGFTACGAPLFDLANPEIMPTPGVVSADGKVALSVGGDWGKINSWFTAYDMKTKEELWRYPNTFVGVHGSHTAPMHTIPGLFRGSFGPVAALSLPDPVGDVWVFTTNLGEWHVLTKDGFYLTSLFNADWMKFRWPEQAVPGADMTDCPPGGGGEDFGGHITVGKDGKVYAQAGFTSYWLLEVKGWDKVIRLPSSKVAITDVDIPAAAKIREDLLQAVSEEKSRVTVKALTPKFTGHLKADFAKSEFVRFEKGPDTLVEAACAWDAENLYVGWQVKDASPWINGASAPEFLYATGDTVDLRLGLGENANPKRTQPALGDLRVSIGNFKGEPKVVGYRKVSEKKQPKTFSSGIVAAYPMDWVGELKAKELKVTTTKDGYTVEVALPWSELGRVPKAGESVKLDFGATYGDAKGLDTMLRNHWSNQRTGLVNDEVHELAMEPAFWGTAKFE
jgi:hypothetical protein